MMRSISLTVSLNYVGSNIVPKEIYDLWETKGWLTPNATLTKVFMSYLGDNKENGTRTSIS